jgi:hypothetical protein
MFLEPIPEHSGRLLTYVGNLTTLFYLLTHMALEGCCALLSRNRTYKPLGTSDSDTQTGTLHYIAITRHVQISLKYDHHLKTADLGTTLCGANSVLGHFS